MKQIYGFIFCFLIGAFGAQAQIIYTSNSFPVAGDVLVTATAEDSTVVVTPASSMAQAWNFSQLVALNTRRDTIQAASDGGDFLDFPTTDILLPAIGNIGIAYTEVSTTAITSIGGGIELFGFSFIDDYTNTHIRQTAPLTYNTTDSDAYAFRFSEHIDSVPFLRQLIDSLTGSLLFSPDSIRLIFNGNDSRLIDAFGTCALADSTYEVLRQKVTSTFILGIEVSISNPLLGTTWLDLTKSVPLPFPTAGTIVRYDFLAENIKQPLVSLMMDSAQQKVELIEYMDTIIANHNAIQYLAYSIDAHVYPNPAQRQFLVQVALASIPTQGYTLRLVDPLGRLVKQETAILEGVHQVATHDLQQGSYLLTLSDDKGRLIYQQGVMVRR